jgi:membrane-bound ClpP family serine protease
MKNTRLILAVITSLLDEAIIIAVILWVLPRVGIHLPLWGTVLIACGFVVYAVTVFQLGTRILKRQPVPGLTDMSGMEGRTTELLNPEGMVRIGGELWKARAVNSAIEANKDIIVVAQEGLKLLVRKK